METRSAIFVLVSPAVPDVSTTESTRRPLPMRDDDYRLPKSGELATKGFCRGRDFDEDQQFSCPILKSAAGLAHAHRRLRHAEVDAADFEVTCIGPGTDLRIWMPEPAAEPYFDALEDILGYMYSIDQDVAAALSPPNPSATTHHEGIGSMIGRLAFFHTLTFPLGPGVLLDAGPLMRLLVPESVRYDQLVDALMEGELRLPTVGTNRGSPRAQGR
ncbi:hypothetical protein ACFWPH_28000 [Nocardia sp. NPDC058499]|uniref:hypothetical protein n=1 Tax=Nocardia sp. NPDC058499 TaxID=3346530 RepID=UPI003651DBE9